MSLTSEKKCIAISNIRGDFHLLVHLLTKVTGVASYMDIDKIKTDYRLKNQKNETLTSILLNNPHVIENQKWNWTVTDTTLVVLGDSIDRFSSENSYNHLRFDTDDAIEHETYIINCFQSLKHKCNKTNNNNIVVLMGDHELMNLAGDFYGQRDLRATKFKPESRANMDFEDFYKQFHSSDFTQMDYINNPREIETAQQLIRRYKQSQVENPEDDLQKRRYFIDQVLKPFCEKEGVIYAWGSHGSMFYFSHASINLSWIEDEAVDFTNITEINDKWRELVRQKNYKMLQTIFGRRDSPIFDNSASTTTHQWQEDIDKISTRLNGSFEELLPLSTSKNINKITKAAFKIPVTDMHARYITASTLNQKIKYTNFNDNIKAAFDEQNEFGLDQIILKLNSKDITDDIDMFFIHNGSADVYCAFDDYWRVPSALQITITYDSQGQPLHHHYDLLAMDREEYKEYKKDRIHCNSTQNINFDKMSDELKQLMRLKEPNLKNAMIIVTDRANKQVLVTEEKSLDNKTTFYHFPNVTLTSDKDRVDPLNAIYKVLQKEKNQKDFPKLYKNIMQSNVNGTKLYQYDITEIWLPKPNSKFIWVDKVKVIKNLYPPLKNMLLNQTRTL